MAQLVIVGVGALGSHVTLFLRNIGCDICVIDMDKVERKNIMAQFHTMMSLSKNKAQALQQALKGLFGLTIKAIPHKLKTDNVEALLGGSDLVVDCTDNKEVRLVIQDFVKAKDIPCVHCSLSADGDFGRVVWTELFNPEQETPGVPTCEDGAALPFFGFAAAVMAQVVQKFVEKGVKESYQIMPNLVTRLA